MLKKIFPVAIVSCIAINSASAYTIGVNSLSTNKNSKFTDTVCVTLKYDNHSTCSREDDSNAFIRYDINSFPLRGLKFEDDIPSVTSLSDVRIDAKSCKPFNVVAVKDVCSLSPQASYTCTKLFTGYLHIKLMNPIGESAFNFSHTMKIDKNTKQPYVLVSCQAIELK